jgi:hypothetical protein
MPRKRPAVDSELHEDPLPDRSGQLLLAALITYVSGEAKVDTVLKRYVPEQVAPVWNQIAQHLVACLTLKLDPNDCIRLLPLSREHHD